jgi:hypothetical protein
MPCSLNERSNLRNEYQGANEDSPGLVTGDSSAFLNRQLIAKPFPQHIGYAAPFPDCFKDSAIEQFGSMIYANLPLDLTRALA